LVGLLDHFSGYRSWIHHAILQPLSL
jgi:hypothetical protein